MVLTALYRYPVKSMLGESLDRCRVDDRGVVGDRAYALVDVETGTVASAKVPSLWGGLFGFSARCVGEPERAAPPLVEITFPDGSVHHSGDADTLRTIAKHNRVEIPGMGTWACAGVYADVSSPGELALGESFELREPTNGTA